MAEGTTEQRYEGGRSSLGASKVGPVLQPDVMEDQAVASHVHRSGDETSRISEVHPYLPQVGKLHPQAAPRQWHSTNALFRIRRKQLEFELNSSALTAVLSQE
jgi:hypothetical protein